MDSHLTGVGKNSHKFLQYFHENLTSNPFCCLIGLSCCVLVGYIGSNILLTSLILRIFVSFITHETDVSFNMNFKIASLINVLDWFLFIIYFIIFFKLQRRHKKIKTTNSSEQLYHEVDQEEYYESDDSQQVATNMFNRTTPNTNNI